MSRIVCLGLFFTLLSVQPRPATAQSTYSEAYTFTTFAGLAAAGSADGVGTAAQFHFPAGVAVDAAGNVYVADSGNGAIRKVTPAGVVTTIAGLGGTRGSADGTNTYARFSIPFGMAVDGAGSLYVADTRNNTIRKVTPAGTNWVVTTLAGQPGTAGTNDGVGTNARFDEPEGVAVDSATNIYVADSGNHTIRIVTPVGTNWVVTTLAGEPGTAGTNDGVGTNARFNDPEGVAVDSSTNVYVADSFNATIRQVTPAGVVTTIAGLAGTFGSDDGTGSAATFDDPVGLAVDSTTNIYVADLTTIRKVMPVGTNWVVTTLAGQPDSIYGKDGVGTNAQFGSTIGVALDGIGNVYVTDDTTLRRITSAGLVTTVAGAAYGTEDGTGSGARFDEPTAVAVDNAGNLYVADSINNTIRKITSAGNVSTIAGAAGITGANDDVGTDARFNYPQGVAVDAAGNVYVADAFNHTIRKVTPPGVVTTIAGLAGVFGTADGTGSNARFGSLFSASPRGVAVDSSNNVYVADSSNHTIRKATPVGTSWVVTTLAGRAGFYGSTDGTGTNARFNYPEGVAVDSSNNVYVADYYNDTIRKVTPAGVVSTIAGKARQTGSADGTGTNAMFYRPAGVAVDAAGNIFVADSANNTIRKITSAGVVSTIGGNAAERSGSADGAGSAARFYFPDGVAVDGSGNLLVADTGNNTIRKGGFLQYAPTSPVPFTPPANNATLVVTLLPPEANGQWRFPWELRWHASGGVVSNLATGNYPIEFRSMPGWLAIPPSLTGNDAVAVAGQTSITNQYFPTLSLVDATNTGGSLTVNMTPNAPAGAGWGFLGDSTVFPPGYSTNLLAGTYLIGFQQVSSYVTPPNLSVQVSAGQPTVISVNYLSAASPPDQVLLPVPVTNSISDLTDYPFGFNGQLQSDRGYGSGVAVQQNVVLTAAHLVFNDDTLSYVSQAYWYFRREADVFEPKPLAARAFYVLSGYAAQRTNDLESGFGVDQSSSASRNLDVAALYFESAVAGGGYGGYLHSDTVPNSWLVSASLKMLVGYPVDGSLFGNASISNGVMYHTYEQPYPLSLAPDVISGQQEVYIAPWFLSYPGNSGGPLYVQFNGYYYPAGVYLGTLYNGSTYSSAVRAIDSNVVALIVVAQGDAGTGTNNTGGGVLTIIPVQGISGKNLGHIQFRLGPPAAVRAGAGWKLHTDPPDAFGSDPNYTLAVDSTNDLQVEFKPIVGWNLPTNQTVRVFPGPITTNSAFYTVIRPVLVADAKRGIGLTGTTDTTYLLQYRTSLTSGIWLPLATNKLGAGFNPLLPWPTTNGSTAFYRAKWLP